MDAVRHGKVGWALRRGAISLFLSLHLGATVLWILPECPIRRLSIPFISYYIMPLGMWQYWGMFAPDPSRDTLTLEAEVVDSRGMRHGFQFTRVADFPWWRAVPRFRHSKFVANLTIRELEGNRILAARHAARQLDLPIESYPLKVDLFFRIKSPPVPGGPPADPMEPTRTLLIGSYVITERREGSR